jgi:hypothetical protein
MQDAEARFDRFMKRFELSDHPVDKDFLEFAGGITSLRDAGSR